MRRPVIYGNYLLLERVSVGGMAEVFKAKSFGIEGFEKILAIKRILPSLAEDDDFITMFIDEAKIAGQLSHANIAQIYELGKIDGSHFIAMEFVWGKDVLQLQNRFRRLRRRMPLPLAAFIAGKICEGLDYAHRKRNAEGMPLDIIHRDVSPQNVIVSYEGEVKLIDFGIAKAAARSSKTQAGVLKGKFGYMSPEQVRGLPLDRRSDLFALGTVLWEMCVGERLFTGESDFTVLDKVRNAIVPPPSSKNPQVSPQLERIILRALKRDAEDRFTWANEMHDALQEYLVSQPQAFSSANLSHAVKELFARELERERESLEHYRRLKREDLDKFRTMPEVATPAPAISLIHGAPGGDLSSTIDDPASEEALLAALAQDVAQEVDDADVEEVAPEDFDDGATELAPPSFSLDEPGVHQGATQIFEGSSPGVPGQLNAEPTYVFNADQHKLGEEHQQPTMIFSEVAAGGGSLPGMPGFKPPQQQVTGPTQAPPTVSGTVAVTTPAGSSLFKDILIGVLAAAVLALLGIIGWSILSGGEDQRPATLVVSLAAGKSSAVHVDGKRYGTVAPGRVLTIKELSAGAHRVALLGEGEPVARQVKLKPGQVETITFKGMVAPPTSASKPTGLTLKITPSDVRLWVGSRLVGKYDGKEIALESGKEHRVKVSKAGFRSHEETVTLGKGESAIRTIELQKAETGAISVKTTPPGAEVTVDGQSVGKTPWMVEDVAAGKHRISVLLDGYVVESRWVRLGKKQEAALVLPLKPTAKPGETKAPTVTKKPPTVTKKPPTVTKKPPTVTKKPPTVTKKPPTVTKKPPTVTKKPPTVTKKPPTVTKKPPTVTKKPPAAGSSKVGYLVANTEPWARVYVDGRDTKRTTPIVPRSKLELKAGRHKVTFVVKGKKYHFKIKIKAGEVTRLIKELPVE